MLRTNPRQISFYSELYHNIPKNHILKLINSAISLNFVNNALKDSYSSDFGRPAKEPEMMVRILEANTTQKVPERIMKHLIKKIFKEMEEEPHDIPDYTQIEDHNEAKQVMKKALEKVIEEAGEKAPKAVAEAKEVLESDLFIEQKGIRSLVDKDARVGEQIKETAVFQI